MLQKTYLLIIFMFCLLADIGLPQEKIPTKEEVKTLLQSNNSRDRGLAFYYLKKYDYDISGGIDEILFHELTTSQDIWRRASIARILGKDTSVDASRKVPVILDALEQECQNPLSLKPAGYVTESEYLKRQYLFAVEKMGAETITFVRERMDNTRGEFRYRLLIMLGYFSNKDVYSEVLDILEHSEDGFVRQLAAESLGRIGDKRAIPALTRALNDNFKREIVEDVIGPEMKFIYPVRSGAYNALRSLGVVVEPLGKHRFRVVE